ncbi:MAG: hypothetical protein AAB462_01090 [Patescibacteria group bacterium]
MSNEKASLGERVDRRLILDQVAERLEIAPDVKGTLPFVDGFTQILVKRDQIWDDIPDDFDVASEFSGIKGKVILAVSRKKEGFRLFEESMSDPGQRATMLDAYSRCWRHSHAITTLDPDQVQKALHWHRPPTPQAE